MYVICYIVIPIVVAGAKDALLPNPIADNANI